MSKIFNKLLSKWAILIATLAMIVAVHSMSSTCIVLSYQPDVPPELFK